MKQADKIAELKKDERTMKQLEVMCSIVDQKIREHMPNFIKLVQMDVLKEFNKRCNEEGVGEERVKFACIMDGILRQVNKDLEYEIMCQFEEVKKSLK